jgi:hypothetical protein
MTEAIAAVPHAHDPGPKPELTWLPVAWLSVDPRYQRDTGSRRSLNLIDKIAGNFRWSRFGVASVVSEVAKKGGRFFVVDGQHRVEAARRLNLAKVPCVVLPHATVEAAAVDFVAMNRDRVVVTPLHIYHAQLAAGDAQALAIAAVCKAAGVELCRHQVPASQMKPGQTLAVATIAKLVQAGGEKFATRVLAQVAKAGQGVPGAVNAAAIRHAAATGVAAGSPSVRKCLSCRREFKSEHAGHRMCNACKGKSE